MSVIRIIRDDCPHCEAMRDIRIVDGRETMKIRGEEVEFDAEYSVCETCGKDFATAEQMDSELSAARAVYRARHGIIGPEELVALRKRYDISQKAFAKILDIGDLTINSYEQGVLPSGAHNSLLWLVEEPANFRRLYETNKGSLSDRQRAKVERALADPEREKANNRVETQVIVGESSFAPAEKRIVALAVGILKRYGARRVCLFGSHASGKAGPDSDWDFAVEGLHSAKYLSAYGELSSILNGRVDLVELDDGSRFAAYIKEWENLIDVA